MIDIWKRLLGSAAVQISDAQWAAAVELAPLPQWLSPDQKQRLRELCGEMLAQKHFSSAGGMQLDATICLAIAMHCCLPLLGLDLRWLRGWTELVVYPEGFRVRRAHADEAGVVTEVDEELAGEAWSEGPLIVSWGDLLADLAAPDSGCNVVVHEIAHKLDASNGAVNGMPALHRGMSRPQWTQTLQHAFDTLNREIDAQRETWVDPYAGSAPEEFFAVLSEHFMMRPDAVQAEFPDVYRQLAAFYRVDPIAAR